MLFGNFNLEFVLIAMRMKKIYLFYFIIVLTVFYGVKNYFDIDIVDSFSLSNSFPFNLLVRDDLSTIYKNQFGLLIDDNFTSPLNKIKWQEIWMEENGTVSKNYIKGGIDSSNCLQFINIGKGEWTFTYKPLIEVNTGDIFDFSAFIKKDKNEVFAGINICSFDKNKDVINWNHLTHGINKNNEYVFVQEKFKIPNNVSYIQFQLIGRGKGKSNFDDIILFR